MSDGDDRRMSDRRSGLDDFDAYKLMLLDRLEKLETGQDAIATKVESGSVMIATEIAALKVKSGLWGLVGGAIPTGITIAWMLMRGQ